MKLENIKAALKARANSLNLQVPATPIVIDAIVVQDKPVVSKHDNPTVANPPAVKANTPPKKANGKTKPSPQIPLITTSAQIQPADIGSKNKTGDNVTPPVTAAIFSAGDSLPPPTEESSKAPAEKSARKPATRKAKENPASVVSVPVIPLNDIETIVAKYLKAGRDYDRLPNTAKPTLLKSGAEILADVFGFRTTAKVINRIENYDKQFVLYEVCVTVINKDGNVVAEGLGSCNSRERKYLKTDFATNLNTVLKIAKKRAFVDAILTATHASKVFTQDIEDIVNLQLVKPDDRNNTSR